jgi:hypothetical protein
MFLCQQEWGSALLVFCTYIRAMLKQHTYDHDQTVLSLHPPTESHRHFGFNFGILSALSKLTTRTLASSSTQSGRMATRYCNRCQDCIGQFGCCKSRIAWAWLQSVAELENDKQLSYFQGKSAYCTDLESETVDMQYDVMQLKLNQTVMVMWWYWVPFSLFCTVVSTTCCRGEY